eukprot:m.33863 g.33863  ORF g.33863 m.33863 type:complete len:1548 (-) comp7245_c0_seq1:116-4759(-)
MPALLSRRRNGNSALTTALAVTVAVSWIALSIAADVNTHPKTDNASPAKSGKAARKDSPAAGDKQSKKQKQGKVASQQTLAHCRNVVVGAGWSGTYFAYRSAVDPERSTKGTPRDWNPKETCIFEATHRVGGRAYSKAGIPGLQDLRVDLGAYRFDTHSHVLVNQVINNILHLPSRCYDARGVDQEQTCNAYGNLTNVRDAYGNNAGYASGPEGLTGLLEKAGIRFYFGHQLINVEEASGDTTRPVRLTFTNKVSVDVSHAFLNLPAPAIRHLDKNCVLFTAVSKDTKTALATPSEFPGAKQFLVYPHTPWRQYPELREGLFSNSKSVPPLKGRLHDFTGKCTSGDQSDCWGAVLTYYGFSVQKDLDYYASFQNSTADPYTFIPYVEGATKGSSQDRGNEMILAAHRAFVDQLLLKNVSGFNNRENVEAAMSIPTGTVLALWWARDAASSILPAPSGISGYQAPNMRDPHHRMRNLISKPVPKLPIYIGNEAFSGGAGWAEPALTMTERVLWHHFQNKPAWVGGPACRNDCLLGVPPCDDCVSSTWWAQEIASFPPESPPLELIPNCQKSTHDLVQVVQNDPQNPATVKCAQVTTTDIDPIQNRNDSCSTSHQDSDMELSWSWLKKGSELLVSIIMDNAKGWTGVGFGSSMGDADMVVGLQLPNTSGGVTAHQYISTGHSIPTKTPWKDIALKSSSADPSTGRMALSFVVSGQLLEKRVGVIPSGATDSCSTNASDCPFESVSKVDMIFARFSQPLRVESSDKQFPQHTWMTHLQFDFSCEQPTAPTFEQDIRPLFRTKDREAMLFQLDLFDYHDVSHAANEIYNYVRDKAIYNLATGMPKDKPWTLAQIHLFLTWIVAGKPRGKPSGGGGVVCTDPSSPPTFYGNVAGLFRETDRQIMLPHGLDLGKYEDVSLHAPEIFRRVALPMDAVGHMPCDKMWTSEDLNTFQQWMACGKIKGDPSSSGGLSDAEIFYNIRNLASNPTFRPAAKEALQKYLAEARKFGEPGNVESSAAYRLFQKYNNSYFEQMTTDLYQQLVQENLRSSPLTSEFTTREQVINRIINLAPFNLIDGAWISRCCPTGPIDEVHSMLWGILNDELGMGDRTKNHCFLYEQLLDSVGVSFPKTSTRAFSQDPRLKHSAFTVPAYALALAEFSEEFFPELLGTTLQIEWTVIGSNPTIDLFNFWGIDPHFYVLHVGIDNAAHGHGYRAKRAIEIYLDNLRETGGDAAVQDAWRRIWDGFLAFDALGTLGEDLRRLNAETINRSPTKEVMELMNRKATFGSLNHRDKRLGTTKINTLFGSWSTFVDELQHSAWVVPGNPDVSPIMDYLTGFDGPMFKVFSEDDFEIWRRWIREMKSEDNPVGAELDVFDAMGHTVLRVMKTAMSVHSHQRIQLWGPSPNLPSEDVQQPVSVWLQTVSTVGPVTMMKVLAHPKNNLIKPGYPLESTFVTEVLAPGSTMGKMFARVGADAPDLNDARHKNRFWTWTDIVKRWIQDGCPLEPQVGKTWKLFLEDASFDRYGDADVTDKVQETLRQWRSVRPEKSGRHYVH